MLFNHNYLREHKCAEEIINRVYENQDKYEYNDQDALKNKQVEFATYKELKDLSENPNLVHQKYLDISD